jgi:hypothetical protein
MAKGPLVSLGRTMFNSERQDESFPAANTRGETARPDYFPLFKSQVKAWTNEEVFLKPSQS